VVLGLAVAIALGYLIYRGGVKLNLSRFFRITGVVLVLVAAGLVMSTLRAAYEAGWLSVGQQTFMDLSAIARPGSVQESLLTGMLGIRSSLPVVEVIAYLLYAIPMLLVVLWPPRRTPSRQQLGRILTGTAAAALVVAVLLVGFGPAAPATVAGTQGPFDLQGTASGGFDPLTGQPKSGVAVTGTAEITLDGTASADVVGTLAGAAVTGTSTLSASGNRFTGSPISAAVNATEAGLPASLTAEQIAALNNGRLPVGVRAGAVGAAFDVGYFDTVTPAISIDTATGVVLGVDLQLVRTVQVAVPNRGSVPAGTVLAAAAAATPGSLAAGLADQRANHQVVTQVVPGLLVLFAVVLLAFGVPLLRRRRPHSASRADAPTGTARAPDPVDHSQGPKPGADRVSDLADAGVAPQPHD
jgi:high-affinity iron transporter